MESVQQRMKRLGTHEKIVAFVQKQNQNYAFKRRYAVTRVKEFISECATSVNLIIMCLWED